MKIHTGADLRAEYEGWKRPDSDPEMTAATGQLKRCLEFESYLLSEESTQALRNVFAADGDSVVEFCEERLGAINKAVDCIREEACLEVKPKKGKR